MLQALAAWSAAVDDAAERAKAARAATEAEA
jgi:hypothetical protein